MDPVEKVFKLRVDRGYMVPGGLLVLLLGLGICYFGLRGVLPKPHFRFNDYVTMFFCFAVGILFCIAYMFRLFIVSFNEISLDLETRRIDVHPLLGGSFSYLSNELIGYSNSTAQFSGTGNSGLILYFPSGKHVEVYEYSHQGVARFKALLKHQKVKCLGSELSWCLFLRYSFDPK